jgi:hypothetical protein
MATQLSPRASAAKGAIDFLPVPGVPVMPTKLCDFDFAV